MSLESLNEQGKRILSGILDEEINPDLIDLIWNEEPKNLNENHRAVIVQFLRNNRHLYEEKKQKAKEKKIQKAKTKITPEKPGKELTLDDLAL